MSKLLLFTLSISDFFSPIDQLSILIYLSSYFFCSTNPSPIEQKPGRPFKKFLILYQRKHNEKLLIYNKILPDDFHAVNSCCLPTNSPSRIDVLFKAGMAPAVNGSNLHGTNRFVEAGCLHVEKNHRGR
jgi:hypothetical protein